MHNYKVFQEKRRRYNTFPEGRQYENVSPSFLKMLVVVLLPSSISLNPFNSVYLSKTTVHASP
jgi:hypothetical protein